LKNIAAYAGRPGATEEKKAVATALAPLLDAKHVKVLRCLALELLSITGDDIVVPKVAALLKDPDKDVCDEARRCLEGMPGQASLRALIEALGESEGPLKLAVLVSLGQRASPEAADAVIAVTASSNMDEVLTALEALARMGVPKEDRITMPSWESLDEAQRNRLADAWLRWADARASKGAVDDALEVYGGVFQNARSEHLVCAALIGATKAAPDKVVEYLVSSLAREENTVRATAAQLLGQMPPDDTKVSALLDAYRKAGPESRSLILEVLKAWNDKKPSP
jgi:HEAT repeat protein